MTARVTTTGDEMVRFTASKVVVDDSDDNLLLVGFAEEHDGECRQQFHFQRAYTFDEQDVALGMNSVYAERNDQRQGGYGGVERVELCPNRVRVVIGGTLATDMGADEFEIMFALPPDEFERLRAGLRTVFAGFDTLVEHPA